MVWELRDPKSAFILYPTGPIEVQLARNFLVHGSLFLDLTPKYLKKDEADFQFRPRQKQYIRRCLIFGLGAMIPKVVTGGYAIANTARMVIILSVELQ